MRFRLSAPAYKHTSLDKPAGCPSTTVVCTKHLHVFWKNSNQASWICAIRSFSSNSRYVVCSACVSGRNYPARGQLLVTHYESLNQDPLYNQISQGECHLFVELFELQVILTEPSLSTNAKWTLQTGDVTNSKHWLVVG